jgi:glycosyltransferase involved in cell wall biosynthesis
MSKINILFNADVLTQKFDKSVFGSGVFFAAYNILLNLKHRDTFNIVLSVHFRHMNMVKKMKRYESLSTFQYCVYIDEQELRSSILKHKRHIKNSKRLIEKIIPTLKIFRNRMLLMYYYAIDRHKSAGLLKNISVYFSPTMSECGESLKYPHIIHFILLHDAIPILFPEYYPLFDLNDDNDGYTRQLRLLSKNNYYFCNSECTKGDYLKYFGNQLDANKMLVFHHASSHKFTPDYDKRKLAAVFENYNIYYKDNVKYIFSLCTLEPRKNLAFTIGCFIKFIKKHNIQDLYLYLGGGQWETFIKKLEEQINTFDEYRDKIIRLGYIDDEDVNILYSNSLFFTYISQYEGFGVPPLEAMQAGTPIITSNNSSLPEVVGDAAITIDYNSEAQCIAAFEKLYFNEDIRADYITKGIERAKLFSWGKTVDKMSDVIMSVVNQKK